MTTDTTSHRTSPSDKPQAVQQSSFILQAGSAPPAFKWGMIIVLGLGATLPLPLLTTSPLHHDEALYAYWARLISSGQDVMLHTVAVDKPPLFIYTLAIFFKVLGISETIARLPSLLAHMAIIFLTLQLGARLYNHQAGLLAALLISLSPYAILFAPTALTDPLMVACILAASLAAIVKRPLLAGLGLGLAAATKQQGVFFLPLILGFLTLPGLAQSLQVRRLSKLIGICLLTFIITLAVPLIWDAARAYRPGFWLQSSLSYGGIATAVGQFSDRFLSFLNLLQYVTASSGLNLIFIVGLPLLLLVNWWLDKRTALPDWLLAGFFAIFIVLHAIFSFQVWDRYLLGLVPLICLLLARILLLPISVSNRLRHMQKFSEKKFLLFVSRRAWSAALAIATFVLVAALMLSPVQQAINAVYPLGGDHGAFYGTAEITAYLRRHAGANVTLYHRWLGGHWRFYLFDFPYDFRFWQSPQDLAQQASANVRGMQYIAFPAWQSSTAAQLALADEDLHLILSFKTYRPEGTPGIFLYRIESTEARR
jgi:4-amino-4-deoxy-L-arabinose transferase-like glycosyltransferase